MTGILEESSNDPHVDPHNQTNHEVTGETTCLPSPSVFGTFPKTTGM